MSLWVILLILAGLVHVSVISWWVILGMARRMAQLSSMCLSDWSSRLAQACCHSGGRTEEREWKCVSIFSRPLLVSRLLSTWASPEAAGEALRKGRTMRHHGKLGLSAQCIIYTMSLKKYFPKQRLFPLRGILVPAVKTIVCFIRVHMVPALYLIKQQNSPGYDIL